MYVNIIFGISHWVVGEMNHKISVTIDNTAPPTFKLPSTRPRTKLLWFAINKIKFIFKFFFAPFTLRHINIIPANKRLSQKVLKFL